MYKSKYSPAFKVMLAERSLDGESSLTLSREYNVPSRKIRYWVQIYSIHGPTGLVMPLMNPSVKTKFSILQAMLKNGWSLGHTSTKFKLSSPGNLLKWQQDYDAFGLSGLQPIRRGRKVKQKPTSKQTKPSQEMTEKELREELEYLRTENAVLKKLEALAQKKRSQGKKRS